VESSWVSFHAGPGPQPFPLGLVLEIFHKTRPCYLPSCLLRSSLLCSSLCLNPPEPVLSHSWLCASLHRHQHRRWRSGSNIDYHSNHRWHHSITQPTWWSFVSPLHPVFNFVHKTTDADLRETKFLTTSQSLMNSSALLPTSSNLASLSPSRLVTF